MEGQGYVFRLVGFNPRMAAALILLLMSPTIERVSKNTFLRGCREMVRCKACEILRNEAGLWSAAVTKNERNAADGRLSTAS
jgi:hypothetical protein